MKTQNKVLKAVAPFFHPGFLNFKKFPYESWVKLGGSVARCCYPLRAFHSLAFRFEWPTLWKSKQEARLRFVEPVSLSFDTYPDYARYEVVPMIWDCWPKYYDMTCCWLQKHKVKTVICSSRQTAERIKQKMSYLHVIWCPEAVDGELYKKDRALCDREIDLLEFGRSNEKIFDAHSIETVKINGVSLRHICTKQNGKFIYTNEQLYEVMGNAKVTIALPRSLTQPELAGDIETLTQRYWECMFSRIVMVGHAPKELVDFIGYNPVIELRSDVSPIHQIVEILSHINDYQSLVDRNRATAERKGSWNVRMKWLMKELEKDYTL